jgi:hypothetical protein
MNRTKFAINPKYLNKPLCDNFDEFQVPHYQFLSRTVLMSHSGSSASEVCKLDLKKQNGVINFCNCIGRKQGQTM